MNKCRKVFGLFFVLLLHAIHVNGGTLTTEPWVDDVSSQVSSSKIYTHLIDFGNNTSGPSYDGVIFNEVPNSGGMINSSAYGFTFTSEQTFNDVSGQSSNLQGDFSNRILEDFVFANNEAQTTLTVQGLIPGVSYRLTLYSMGWEDGVRKARMYGDDAEVPADDDESYMVNQDEFGNRNGQLTHYDYIAPQSGELNFTITRVDGGGWHHYGFTNEFVNTSTREPVFTDVFTDNFDSSDENNPKNLNYDLSGRQDGETATVAYRKYKNDHLLEDGALHLWWGRVSLANSFIGGPVEIQYDITSIGEGGGNWSGIRFGSSDELGWMTDSGSIGILLRNNGQYQLFKYDGTNSSGIYVNEGVDKSMTNITGTLKIQITDIVDSRPFNGTGFIQVKFFWSEDGTFGNPFAIYLNSDISNANAITFLDENPNTGVIIDNLVVKMDKVPEGDLDGNYQVDINDLSTMSTDWLSGEIDELVGNMMLVSNANAVMPSPEEGGNWSYSVETDGADVNWHSDISTLSTDYTRYTYVYDMTSVEAFDGTEWNDITKYVSPEREANPTKDGLPFNMDDYQLEALFPTKGSYEISFKFMPITDWVNFCCCLPESKRNAWVAGDASFGVIFRTNGIADAWANGTSLSGGIYSTASNITSTVCSAKVVISDTTDGAPFDGKGETQIDVYANDGDVVTGDSPIITYTEASGGFTSNYLQFGSYSVGAMSDINITFVPYDDPNDPTVNTDPIVILSDTFIGKGNPDIADINYNIDERQSGYLAPFEYDIVDGSAPLFGLDPNDYNHPMINEENCYAFSSSGKISPISECKYGDLLSADITSYVDSTGHANIDIENVSMLSDYSKIRINGNIDVQPAVNGWSVLQRHDPNYAGGEMTVSSGLVEWNINSDNNEIMGSYAVYVPETALDLTDYEQIRIELEFDQANTDVYSLSMGLYSDFSEPYMFAGEDSFQGGTLELLEINSPLGLHEWVIDLENLPTDDLSSIGVLVFGLGIIDDNVAKVSDSANIKFASITLVDDQCDCEVILSDVNRNCIVDLNDFEKLASNWLLGVE